MGVPTMMYRRKGAAIVSEVFDSDAIPSGWVDSPAKLHKSGKPVKTRNDSELKVKIGKARTKAALERLMLKATDGAVDLDKRKNLDTLKADALKALDENG